MAGQAEGGLWPKTQGQESRRPAFYRENWVYWKVSLGNEPQPNSKSPGGLPFFQEHILPSELTFGSCTPCSCRQALVSGKSLYTGEGCATEVQAPGTMDTAGKQGSLPWAEGRDPHLPARSSLKKQMSISLPSAKLWLLGVKPVAKALPRR